MLPLAVGFMYTLYAVANRFADRKAANLLVIAFAIYPLHILLSAEPLTELPASLLLLITISIVLGICAGSRDLGFPAACNYVGAAHSYPAKRPAGACLPADILCL